MHTYIYALYNINIILPYSNNNNNNNNTLL